MAPISSFSGIASGFDFNALVDQIIKVEGRGADQAKAQISAATQRQDALKTYRGLVDTLRTSLGKLTSAQSFDRLAATVSGTGLGGRVLVSAAVGVGAERGTYQLEVTSLARAEKRAAAAVTAPDTALGLSGTVSVNGVAVNVVGTDTLVDLRDKLNTANTGTAASKVSATILTVGANESRLVLTSEVAGSAGMSLSDSGGVLSGLGLLDPGAQLVAGQDAQFSIDEIPFVRATNAVSDAIAGVTLKLEQAEPGTTVALAVDRDRAAALTDAKAVVDAYNAVGTFLRQQGTASDANRPPLYGDNTLRLDRAAFAGAMVGIIAGQDGIAVSGGTAGLSVSRTGVLSLDESKFSAAFDGQLEPLRALFGTSTGATALQTHLDDLVRLNTGTLDTKSRALDTRIDGLQGRVDRIQTRLEHRRAALVQQFSRMESAISALQSQASYLNSQIAGLNSSKG